MICEQKEIKKRAVRQIQIAFAIFSTPQVKDGESLRVQAAPALRRVAEGLARTRFFPKG